MDESNLSSSQIGTNPFLDAPQSAAAIEYKKGYVMRKCCFDSNYKKSKCIIIYPIHNLHISVFL